MLKQLFSKPFLKILTLALLIAPAVGEGSLQYTPQSTIQAPLQMPIELENRGMLGSSGIEAALTPSLHNHQLEPVGPRPSIHREGELFQVVIVASHRDATSVLSQQISQRGGILETSHEGQLLAMLSLNAIEKLSSHKHVEFIRLPHRVAPRDISENPSNESNDRSSENALIISEGTAVIGSQSWNAAGITGQGVKVGIIDQFGGYRALMGSELPTEQNVKMQSFARHGQIYHPDVDELSQDHGTNVGEIIYDIAPGASQYLGYIETAVEFQRAINWLVEQDVDVANTSLGFESACYRGGGIFEPVLSIAKDSGISWSTSAGNEAASFLHIEYEDSDSDDLHNFGPTVNTNRVQLRIEERTTQNGGRFGLARMQGVYSWDAPCTLASDDYEVVASLEEDGELIELEPFEEAFNDWAWEPSRPIKFFSAFKQFDASRIGDIITVHIGIKKKSAEAPDANFLINFRCVCLIEFTTEQGSVSLIEPSVSPSTFTVAAAHHSPTACPTRRGSGFYCPDGRLLYYSSQGPTTDGRRKPDITAPTHVSTASSGKWTGQGSNQNPGFGGTSGASPHVAGSMALIVEALSAIHNNRPTANDVFEYLIERTEDLGEAGYDHAYGHGLLHLGQPPDISTEAGIGQLIATQFISVEFVAPADWDRALEAGCITYTNITDSLSPVRVTKPEGELLEFDVPSGGQVLLCDDFVHIDTR